MTSNDGQERIVTHLHFTGWPDWETPHDESLEVFKNLINTGADFVKAQNDRTQGPHEKLLLHCRAGIGRTGTTVALINCMLHYKEF